LAYFDGHRGAYELHNRAEWLSTQHASLLGNLAMPVPAPGPVGVALGQWAVGAPGGWPRFLSTRDDGPLGVALLAVRAARRSIRDNPDDAKSYFLLGEAYLRLAEATRERSWRYQLPAFDRIRMVQAIAGFQNVLILRPDSPAAHGRLARLYRDRGSLDLALHHLDRLIAITQARGPQPGEKPEAARDALSALQRERDGLAAEVRKREDALGEGKGRRVLDLAREAAAVGLPNRALDTLLKSDSSEFGPEGARLELDLLLWAGRVRDVRNWLDSGLENTIGAVTYREIAACLAAATGNYRDASQQMRGVAAALLQVSSRLPTPRTQASSDVTRALLATQFVGGNFGAQSHQFLVRQGLLVEVEQITGSLGREANALVVAGLLALEAGEVAEAESLLAQALTLWQNREGVVHEGRLDFAGRPVAQDCLALIARHRGQ
jgi:tetratricopeptide (TPR) repeat protein